MFSMINGAQIRLSEEDETSGIRFGAKLSVVDYEGLKANGYKSLRFGMIIAPAEYADGNAFTVENLFGETAKYNWPTWDGEKWVNPTPNSTQKNVINIFNTKMTLNGNGTEDAADDYYEIKGAITKIQDANLWKEFVGVGYIQATDASGDHYIVATPADNERSIATVATVLQDDYIEEIYNGPTDDRVDVAKEQSAKAQKVYGDKLESKFTYKGLQIVDVSVENAEWIYEGVSNVTALYDKNFRKVEFENVTDGVKLVNAPANGEHDFYAVTENGNYIEHNTLTIKNSKLKSYQKEKYRTVPIFPKYSTTLDKPIKHKANLKQLRIEFKNYCPNHTLKDLRHTFTTRARECGIDNELVAVWTGHSLGNITAGVYTHFSMEHQQKQAEKLVYNL